MIRTNDSQETTQFGRLLVTGAGGFIGNHAVTQLASAAQAIVAITGPGDPKRDWPDNVQSFEVDVSDPHTLDAHSLDRLVHDIDAVVHLAGPPSVRDSFQSPRQFLDVHTGGTTNLLRAAELAGVRRLVYVSSAEVYGQPLRNPVDELHPLQPKSPYGAAKIGAESMVEAFTRFTDMSAVIVRPFSVYGPGQTMNSLLGTIIRQLQNGQRIELADLEPIRDYIYVSDLIAAIRTACTVEIDRLEILNLGSGRGISVARFAELVSQAMDVHATITQTKDNDRPSEGRIVELVSDCRRAERVLGWTPQVSLLEGLRSTIESGEKV